MKMCSPDGGDDDDTTKKLKSSDLEENMDWVALKEIYSECILKHENKSDIGTDTDTDTNTDTTLNLPVSLSNTIAIRIIQDEDIINASIENPQKMTGKEDDNDNDGEFEIIHPKFQYCILSKIKDPPIIQVSFHYTSQDDPPTSLDVALLQYPKSWPGVDENPWTAWITEQAHNVLEETFSSYSVCDFIEHESMRYFKSVDEGFGAGSHGYSAILFQNFNKYTDQGWNVSGALKGTGAVEEGSPSQDDDYDDNNNMMYLVTDIREKRKVQSTSTSDMIHKYARRILKRNWKRWHTYQCPICFCEGPASEAVELDCRHFYCVDCMNMYVKTTVSDIHLHRTNPFICPIPSCKKDMKVLENARAYTDTDARKQGQKQKHSHSLITDEQRDRILLWEKDIQTPRSRTLTICPRSKCQSRNMRRVDNSSTNTFIFCEDCNATFCEMCMKRIYNYKHQKQSLNGKNPEHECDERGMMKFCRKYSRASDEIKAKCHEKWHWIEEYIAGREMDLSAKIWLRENGMPCPNCKTGIERSDGCFHMHCTLCGTHFCYECGDEIFAPFYGTHHCWEEELEVQEDMYFGNIFQ